MVQASKKNPDSAITEEQQLKRLNDLELSARLVEAQVRLEEARARLTELRRRNKTPREAT